MTQAPVYSAPLWKILQNVVWDDLVDLLQLQSPMTFTKSRKASAQKGRTSVMTGWVHWAVKPMHPLKGFSI